MLSQLQCSWRDLTAIYDWYLSTSLYLVVPWYLVEVLFYGQDLYSTYGVIRGQF